MYKITNKKYTQYTKWQIKNIQNKIKNIQNIQNKMKNIQNMQNKLKNIQNKVDR